MSSKLNMALKGLGLESVDDTIATSEIPVEPTEIVDVVPGEAEELEISVKEEAAEIEDTMEVAEEFGEVAEGLEAIRDHLVAMKGTTISTEAFMMAGLATRQLLGRIGLSPRNVAGLESFSEPTLEIGIAPTSVAKSDLAEPDTNEKSDEQAPDISPEDQAAAAKAAGEIDPGKTTTELAVGKESDETDVGGTVDTSDKDDTAEDSPVADVTDDLDLSTDGGEGKGEHRVEIKITDDDLTVAIEALDMTIERLNVGKEGLIDKATKAIGDLTARIFKGYESVGTRANNLRVAIKELGGEPKRAEISTSSAHKLHIGGKVDIATITQGVNNLNKVGEIIYGKYAPAVKTFYKGIALNFIKSVRGDQTDRTSNITATNNAVKYTKQIMAEIDKLPDGNNTILPGNKKFGTLTEANIDFPWIVEINENDKTPTSQTFKTPTLAEVDKLAASIAATAMGFSKRESVVEELEGAAKASISEAKSIAAAEKAGFWRRLTAALSTPEAKFLMTIINGYMTTPVNDFTNHAFSVLRSAVQVGENAAKQYSKKSDK